MKKIIITGCAGHDAMTKTTQDGSTFVVVRIAVNSKSKGNATTDWIEALFNNKNAENALMLIKKGTKLLVEGSFTTHAYINKNNEAVASVNINVATFEVFDRKELSQSDTPSNNEFYSTESKHSQYSDVPF